MKANELRIGNWVRWNYEERSEGNVYPVEYGYELDDIKNNPNIVKPIPLTEEWLVKFGFDFDGYCSYWKSEIELTKDTMDEHFQSFNNVGSGLCQKEIKYVNQLQNLYFALTGEELTDKNDEKSTNKLT
jgi:hypothetical protein